MGGTLGGTPRRPGSSHLPVMRYTFAPGMSPRG
nr:MAG TPA: hypothetical protein [Caudoviricetes sp.]